MKYEIKEDIEPMEIILCPFCGARLNRIGNGLLPTSCHGCNHQRFTPRVIKVLEVIETA